MFVSTTCNSQDQPGLAWCTKGAEIARKNKEELIKAERRCPLSAPFCSGFLCDPCAFARNVFSSLCEKRLLSLSDSPLDLGHQFRLALKPHADLQPVQRQRRQQFVGAVAQIDGVLLRRHQRRRAGAPER